MAIGSGEFRVPQLRRFVPKDAVLASSTFSSKIRSSPKQTPIPTAIVTNPHVATVQPQAVSLMSTSSQTTSSTNLRIISTPSAAASISSAAAESGSGISTSTLIISIVVPLVLIAILVPLVILLCLTCRRKRRRQNRRSDHSQRSNHSQTKPRSPGRQKELLAHRPRGKYGPSMLMRRPNSFSGFQFNFSRPRTVLSRISARSPTAMTPVNASRSATLVSVPERDEDRPAMPRRPAAHLLSRYASRDGHIPTGRWDSPCSSPPPAFIPNRPVTLAHPFIPSPLKTPQIPDTPRSLSPQLQVATPVEIQRLSGPYTPISQVLRQPDKSRTSQTRPPPQRQDRSPPAERPEASPTSANLQTPFVQSASPALTDVSGLSFDPSMWIAAYERDSVVNHVEVDDNRRMDPHQMV